MRHSWPAPAALVLLAGLGSLALGRDNNWDLRNYHYYNAYAFMQARHEIDIAPAQVQTYLNPLGDLPFYFMALRLPAPLVGFLMGILHGINLALVYALFLRLNTRPPRAASLAGFGLALFAGLAPGFLGELGNTMNENLTSLFVLGALLLLVREQTARRPDRAPAYLEIAAAGALAGGGFGLKPAVAVFFVAALLALLLQPAAYAARARMAAAYVLGGVVGALVTAGFWWAYLWQRFGNPFFPFYNHVFQSPYFAAYPIRWSLFVPRSLPDFVAAPFLLSLDSSRFGLEPFRDVRFGLLYALAIAWMIWRLSRHPGHAAAAKLFDARGGNTVLTFALFGFAFWLSQSGSYRFLIPVELLAPLCFLLIIDRTAIPPRLALGVTAVAGILVLALMQPLDAGRLPWTDRYVQVDAPRLHASQDAVVIMLGGAPTAYVIPHLPQAYRFLRAGGNLTAGDVNGLFVAELRAAVDAHDGPLYVLYDRRELGGGAGAILAAGSLPSTLSDCFLLVVNTPDQIEICRLSP